MTYNHIADAAQDSDLRRRVAACFAQETTGTEQPEALASVHMWRIAADNDIAAAYAYGVDTDGRTLPWRILGRAVRPYVLAVGLATTVSIWSVSTDRAVGQLLDGWTGAVIAAYGVV